MCEYNFVCAEHITKAYVDRPLWSVHVFVWRSLNAAWACCIYVLYIVMCSLLFALVCEWYVFTKTSARNIRAMFGRHAIFAQQLDIYRSITQKALRTYDDGQPRRTLLCGLRCSVFVFVLWK